MLFNDKGAEAKACTEHDHRAAVREPEIDGREDDLTDDQGDRQRDDPTERRLAQPPEERSPDEHAARDEEPERERAERPGLQPEPVTGSPGRAPWCHEG